MIINEQKIKDFIMMQYNIVINIEKFNCIYKSIFDSGGNIIDNNKFKLFDDMISMMFGLNFEKMIEMSNDIKIQNVKYRNSLLANKLKELIDKKDIEISSLKDENEELRTNYWNIQNKIPVFKPN